jgi:hypothetical protein
MALMSIMPSLIYCQADTITAVKGAIMSPEGRKTGNHSLYGAAGGGSNMVYLGTSLSKNKPYYGASLAYGYKNTFFASANVTHLSETDPFIAFSSLSLNYSHAFNDWFDLSADLAWYNTPESLSDSLFADFAYFNITTGFDWKILYTRIFFSGVVSESNGFYMQISNSRYFETPSFFNGKSLVSFNPDIDLLFGNLLYSETQEGSRKYKMAPPFSHGNQKPGSNEKYTEKFGLVDIEFSFPVTFNYGRFTVEAEPAYILPVYSSQLYQSPEGFTFYLNLFVKIF